MEWPEVINLTITKYDIAKALTVDCPNCPTELALMRWLKKQHMPERDIAFSVGRNSTIIYDYTQAMSDEVTKYIPNPHYNHESKLITQVIDRFDDRPDLGDCIPGHYTLTKRES